MVGRAKRLEVAFTTYQKLICKECGHPVSVCREMDRFSVSTQICHAKAAVEDHQKSNKSLPGEILVPRYEPPVQL